MTRGPRRAWLRADRAWRRAARALTRPAELRLEPAQDRERVWRQAVNDLGDSIRPVMVGAGAAVAIVMLYGLLPLAVRAFKAGGGLGSALASPLALVVCLTVIGVAWLGVVLLQRQLVRPHLWRLIPHLCDACGYDLTANASGRCPECGWAVDAEKDASPP